MIRSTRKWVVGTLALVVVVFMSATILRAQYYQMPVARFLQQEIRVLATPLLSVMYRDDLRWVNARVASYWHGSDVSVSRLPHDNSPFVYEPPDADYLKRFRQTYRLQDLVTDAPSEYDALIRLGGWVGAQFDHGTDPVVGGTKACDPVGLMVDAKSGKKYWCEIAARLMVHAAASLGIPARIITASRDGFTWEHAVAEVWSNDFGKWFVIDTDFNFVYEHGGVPLSAVDLLLKGEDYKSHGQLHIRQIAPPKPNIPPGDALYVYRYVHVDMRNDWCTRTLRSGSPAGGDRATWWMARQGFRSPPTAKVEVTNPAAFVWPLNVVEVRKAGPDGISRAQFDLRTFSPYFENFEMRIDDGQWARSESSVAIPANYSRISFRVNTVGGWKGRVTTVLNR